MPSISYTDFSGGLDRRLSVNSQDANKLWTLKNAYVTNGKRLKKRPALKLISNGFTGSFGLVGAYGSLAVFRETGSGFTVPGSLPITVFALDLDPPPAMLGSPLDGIYDTVLFQEQFYVVAHYDSGSTYHHYRDGSPTTYITDVNCPHTAGITKAASRIFAPTTSTVRYCAAGDARDWTTASDAGFLAVGLQQDVASDVRACGTFQGSLVVLFDDGSQIWSVAEDPSANAISKRIYGTGTSQPISLASFSNDLVFLSPFGFRSMTVQSQTDRIDDNDVGSPIDSLVVPDVTASLLTGGKPVMGKWIPQLGQYWAVFDMGTYSKAWVYTFSKTSRVACWSEYVFPVRLSDITTISGRVYMRSDDSIYEFSDAEHTDDGDAISVEIQMAFQDAKQPGVTKQFWGADMVSSGSWGVSYKYDPRDDTRETNPLTVSNDTRPGDVLPVDVVAPVLAPVFTHSGNEAASIDSVILYFYPLGAL